MTSVRDFDESEGRSRAPTVTVSPDPQHASHFPVAHDSPALDRVGSASSRLSAHSTIELRHRRPSRSNTITTYHDHQLATDGQPGAEPGFDTSAEDDTLPAHLINLKARCEINIIDFSHDRVQRMKCNNENLLASLEIPRTDDLPCRWISVNGLSWDVIRMLGNKYNLHRLAVEDLVHTKTRTKVDWYADHAFIVLTLQKLVLLHQHTGRNDKCNCQAGRTTEDEDYEIDELFESNSRKRHKPWWDGFHWTKPTKPKHLDDALPQYLDRDKDGKMDEYISAHSGVSEDSPITPIRTLHRYESAQIPEHTAWMERHSALTKDDLAVSVEQVSIFLLSDNSVLSFFEHSADDVETPILERLHSKETILRRSNDASLLTQAIIDAIVDLSAPVREAYNKTRKELQIDAMTNPNIRTSRSLHIFGEEVDMLQNLFKPIVHLVNSLRDHNTEPQPHVVLNENPDPKPTPNRNKRDREGLSAALRKQSADYRRIPLKRAESITNVSISPLAHTYFGDVLDHCITMISVLEQMDASANNISTLIFNTVGAKTNNFMMILAVVTVFFAPLTFISGYFGMNFADGSGLHHPFAFFWVVAAPSLMGFMLLVFGFMLWDNIRDLIIRRGVKSRFASKPKSSTRRAGSRR